LLVHYLAGKVSVDLGGRRTIKKKSLPDCLKRGAVFNMLGGEGVPEGVNLGSQDPSFLEVLLNRALNRSGTHPSLELAQEESRIITLGADSLIGADGSAGSPVQGEDASLSTLTQDPNRADRPVL